MQNDVQENEYRQKKYNQPTKNEAKYKSFRQIVTNFYNEEIESIEVDEDNTIKNKGTIIIEPKIIYDRFSNDIKMEFKIGNKRLYKLKDLSEFYDRMINKKFYRYGSNLEFIHTKEMFKEEYHQLLDFILKYAEIIKYVRQFRSR